MAHLPTAPFFIHGARDAMAGGLAHIKEHAKGIERTVVERPGLAFDLAKTQIESTCRTLLRERLVAYGKNDDLPKLSESVTKKLPLLPPAASDSDKAQKSLKKTLSGLKTAILGICELRNQCGFASHGFDSPRPSMEGVQALLAAAGSKRRTFGANSTFNDALDETNGPFRISNIEFPPSEVLFILEPETYRIYLARLDGGADSEANASVGREVQP